MNLVPTHILATVDNDRLVRGVEGLASGAYTITLTRLTEQEISAYVTNGDNKSYSVTLTENRSFCGCPDSMYRGTSCKHQVALALYTIRNNSAVNAEAQNDTSKPFDLKLAKVRQSTL